MGAGAGTGDRPGGVGIASGAKPEEGPSSGLAQQPGGVGQDPQRAGGPTTIEVA